MYDRYYERRVGQVTENCDEMGWQQLTLISSDLLTLLAATTGTRFET